MLPFAGSSPSSRTVRSGKAPTNSPAGRTPRPPRYHGVLAPQALRGCEGECRLPPEGSRLEGASRSTRSPLLTPSVAFVRAPRRGLAGLGFRVPSGRGPLCGSKRPGRSLATPVVPVAHLGRSLRRDEPRAEPRAHISNTIPHCFLRSSHRPTPPRTRTVNGVGRRVPSHHHSPKAYHSRLAFFLAVYCGLVGIKPHPYKTIGYVRTNRPVGWD